MGETREKNAKVWARDEFDWYVEPIEATKALLTVETFVGKIWDPACGGGNICSTFEAAGYRAIGSDVVKRVDGAKWWWAGDDRRDFLNDFDEALAPNIVCNPPFFRAKGAEAFIRKALELASGKVAMFLDIRFLAGGERANGIFAEHPPHRIWIVTPRVSCPPGAYLQAGGKAGNGSSDWVWLIWDQTSPRPPFPQLGWLRKPGAQP